MRTATLKVIALALVGALALALPAAAQDAKTYTQAELDQLVGPIALYPDALMAQVLMACTYPLEVVEADRWVKANPNLTGKSLDDALAQKTWDPSVISLCQTPQLLARMSSNLDWTQDLGNAFLAQQADVMATAQRLRNEAYKAGNLQSTEQQKVVVEKETIVIQPASPQVVYVPAYNPAVVYGPYWAYPAPMYPAWYAPWPGSAFVRGMAWGAGFAIGASMFGGCNWHGGNVYVNNNVFVNNNIYHNTNINNNYNRNNNYNKNQNWNHNPEHRGNVNYNNKNLDQKYNKSNKAGLSKDAARGYDRPGQNGSGTRDQRPGQNGSGTREQRPGQNGSGTREQRPGQGGSGTYKPDRATTGEKKGAMGGYGNGSYEKKASTRGAESRNKPESGMSGHKGGGASKPSGGGHQGGGQKSGGGGKKR
jgi:uncharacterized membrane protein YgcG